MNIRRNFENKDSKELKRIYKNNDRTRWRARAIKVAYDILVERDESIPSQRPRKQCESKKNRIKENKDSDDNDSDDNDSDFIRFKDYDKDLRKVQKWKKEVWYRTKNLIKNGQFGKALNQLHEIYHKYKVYKAYSKKYLKSNTDWSMMNSQTWIMTSNWKYAILTLSRLLNRPFRGIFLFPPRFLTSFGRKKLEKLQILNSINRELNQLQESKEVPLIVLFTAQYGTWENKNDKSSSEKTPHQTWVKKNALNFRTRGLPGRLPKYGLIKREAIIEILGYKSIKDWCKKNRE